MSPIYGIFVDVVALFGALSKIHSASSGAVTGNKVLCDCRRVLTPSLRSSCALGLC